MKNIKFIITSYVLVFFTTLLLYMMYNVNASTTKLVSIPLILSSVITIIIAIARKPVKSYYKNKFDKTYIYNKKADNDRIKRRTNDGDNSVL